jgi:hypothetical protein
MLIIDDRGRVWSLGVMAVLGHEFLCVCGSFLDVADV